MGTGRAQSCRTSREGQTAVGSLITEIGMLCFALEAALRVEARLDSESSACLAEKQEVSEDEFFSGYAQNQAGGNDQWRGVRHRPGARAVFG